MQDQCTGCKAKSGAHKMTEITRLGTYLALRIDKQQQQQASYAN